MVMKVLIRDPYNNVVKFDSSVEYVMFHAEERDIWGPDVGYGAGLEFVYWHLAGRRIQAFLTSPAAVGQLSGYNILSCRVSYGGDKVPRVTVFVDNVRTDVPNADGVLVVVDTGVSF